MAPSTASAPASTAASTLAAADPAGVVRMEMNRQAHLVLERLDQRGGRARLAQAAMSLMAITCAPMALSSLAILT
jgi:hypothetical protein